ncbi:MAG TPA: tetratricopeptide repeat protein [Noviherbaspirillum sp.]
MATTTDIRPTSDHSHVALERLARLESYLITDPANQQLISDAFDTAIAAGKFDRAETLLERGRRDATDFSAWAFRESNLRIAQRRLEDASALLQSLQEHLGLHPAIGQNLANIAFLQQRFADSRSLLQPFANAEDATANDSSLQVLWLRTLHRLNALQDALDWCDRHMKAGTLSPAAAGVASLICIDADRIALAKRLSEGSLSANPEQMEALAARATVALAERDPAEAKRQLEKALRINPEDGRSWSALGLANLLAGEVEQAVQDFRRAVNFMPSHIGTWHGLGWAHLMRRDLKEAHHAFETALSLDRNFAESHGALAVVQAMTGQRESAMESIERAMRLDKAGLSARYAEAILSGTADNAEAMQILAQRILGDRKATPLGGTTADWLFKH